MSTKVIGVFIAFIDRVRVVHPRCLAVGRIEFVVVCSFVGAK